MTSKQGELSPTTVYNKKGDIEIITRKNTNPKVIESIEWVMRNVEARIVAERGNLITIIENAVEYLENRGVSKIYYDELNREFFHRFLSYAGDAYDEKIQDLWAKILAGELEEPNTYSIRTLAVLRDLTSAEAQTFKNAAMFFGKLDEGESSREFLINDQHSIRSECGFTVNDMTLLEEAGLLNSLSNTKLKLRAGFRELVIGNRSKIDVLVKAGKGVRMPIYTLTTAGSEILHLFDNEISSEEEIMQEKYMIRIVDYLQELWADKAEVQFTDK